jgi:transposase
MMGCLKSDQGQLFYEFHLNDAVPEDHLVRKIDAALDLSWLRGELAPHYSSMGRPSIDPELMIRMLVVGYVFAIRSERLICREVQVNLAYRWFCKLGIEDTSRMADGHPSAVTDFRNKVGTFRTSRSCLVMSVHRGEAEIICYFRVFRILTHCGSARP